jgi:hypothetical protein
MKFESCAEGDETYCLIKLGRGNQELLSVETFVSSMPATNKNIFIAELRHI